jgi:hypothetical protein
MISRWRRRQRELVDDDDAIDLSNLHAFSHFAVDDDDEAVALNNNNPVVVVGLQSDSDSDDDLVDNNNSPTAYMFLFIYFDF